MTKRLAAKQSTPVAFLTMPKMWLNYFILHYPQQVLYTWLTSFALVVHSPGQWKTARTSLTSASESPSPIASFLGRHCMWKILPQVRQPVQSSAGSGPGSGWLQRSPAPQLFEAILRRALNRHLHGSHTPLGACLSHEVTLEDRWRSKVERWKVEIHLKCDWAVSVSVYLYLTHN